MPTTLPAIYLAGPEVFLPNAVEQGAAKAAICAQFGLRGIFPLDPIDGYPVPHTREDICRHAHLHMRTAQGMIANISPYRGLFCDTGTAYEVGYFRGLDRPVVGYTGHRADMGTRIYGTQPAGQRADGRPCTDDLLEVELFGFSDNLMIDGGIAASGGAVYRDDQGTWGMEAFTQAVAHMATLLHTHTHRHMHISD